MNYRTTILFFLILSSHLIALNSPIRIACVGNSITQGFGIGDSRSYPQQLGLLLGDHYEVHNYGIGYRTMLKKGDFPYWENDLFLNAMDLIPQIVIISLGTNDSKPQNWQYKDEFFSDYMDMVGEFRKINPNVQIFVCYQPPVFVTGIDINADILKYEIMPLVDSVKTTANTSLIDFYTPMLGKSNLFPDGIHPNAEGYKLMAQIAYQTIMEGPTGVIRYFSADKNSYEMGESVELFWETTPGTEVRINGELVNDSGSVIVEPSPNAVFKLVTNGVFKDSAIIKLDYIKPGTIKGFKALPRFLDIGSGDTSVISWSAANGSVVTLDKEHVDAAGEKIVTPAETTTYTLIAEGEITDTSFVTVQVLNSIDINRTLDKIVKASKTARNYSPGAVADGDTSTYWKSDIANTQWVSVDLVKYYDIQRVKINWGKVFSTTYHIEILDKTGKTERIFSVSNGDGGIDDLVNLSGITKALRLLCINKNLADSGYIVNELEIYGVPENALSIEQPYQYLLDFKLEQNYPNPFNPATQINYSLPGNSSMKNHFVSLKVFDLLGNELAALVNGEQAPGNYSVKFDGSNRSSGLYIYRIQYNGQFLAKKMLLIK